jgi:hypothetical protein
MMVEWETYLSGYSKGEKGCEGQGWDNLEVMDGLANLNVSKHG